MTPPSKPSRSVPAVVSDWRTIWRYKALTSPARSPSPEDRRNGKPKSNACRWLTHSPDLPGLFERFPEKFPYLLESAARGPLGSYSLLLYAGDEVLVLQADSTLSGPGHDDSFFDRLETWYQQERMSQREKVPGPEADIPFCGGWFLYLGYEAAAEI